MRQIGVAIGSSNANVIGYHFGTREALVEAILLRNRAQIEARRAELLDQAKREGRGADLRTLLDALCRPVFERTNADGLHTYALFLRHISRSRWWARSTYASSIPSTRDILQHIERTQSHVPRKYLVERMQAVGDIVAGALQRMDGDHLDSEAQELMFNHALQMASAVVTMPVNDLATSN